MNASDTSDKTSLPLLLMYMVSFVAGYSIFLYSIDLADSEIYTSVVGGGAALFFVGWAFVLGVRALGDLLDGVQPHAVVIGFFAWALSPAVSLWATPEPLLDLGDGLKSAYAWALEVVPINVVELLFGWERPPAADFPIMQRLVLLGSQIVTVVVLLGLLLELLNLLLSRVFGEGDPSEQEAGTRPDSESG